MTHVLSSNSKLNQVQQKLIANRLVFGQKIHDKNASAGRISGGKSTIIGAGIEEVGKGYEGDDGGSNAGALSPNASEYGSLSPRSWYGIDNDEASHGNNNNGNNNEYDYIQVNTEKYTNDNNADEENDDAPHINSTNVVQLLPLTGHKTTLYNRNLLCKSQDGAKNGQDGTSNDRSKSANATTGIDLSENYHVLARDTSAFSDRTDVDAVQPESQYNSLVPPLPMLLGPGLQVTSKIGKLALPAKKLDANVKKSKVSEKLLRPSTSQVELRARTDANHELKKVAVKRVSTATTSDNLLRLDPPSSVAQTTEVPLPDSDGEIGGIRAVQIVKVSRPIKSADVSLSANRYRVKSPQAPQQRLGSPQMTLMTDSIYSPRPSSGLGKVPLINHAPLPRETTPRRDEDVNHGINEYSYNSKLTMEETSSRKVTSNYKLTGTVTSSVVPTADDILSWNGGALTDLVNNVVSSANTTNLDVSQKSPLKRRKNTSPGHLHKAVPVKYKVASPETIKTANIKIESILNDTYNALNHYDHYEDKNSLLVVPEKLRGPTSSADNPAQAASDLDKSLAQINEQINLYSLVKKNQEVSPTDAFDIRDTLAQDRHLYNQPSSYNSQIGPPPALWESLIKASKLPPKPVEQTHVKIEVFDTVSMASLDDSLFPSSELYQSHANDLFNRALDDLNNNSYLRPGEILNDSVASSTTSQLVKKIAVVNDAPVQLQEKVDSQRIGIISSSTYKFGGGEKNKNLPLHERKNILRDRTKISLPAPVLTVSSSHMPYSPRSGKKNAEDNHKFNARPKLSVDIEKAAPEHFRV